MLPSSFSSTMTGLVAQHGLLWNSRSGKSTQTPALAQSSSAPFRCPEASKQIKLLTRSPRSATRNNMFDMPIIPLSSPEALPATLDIFMGSVVSSRTTRRGPVDLIRELLPHCAIQRPLSNQSIQFLSHDSMGFKDLLGQITTPEGQAKLGTAIGPGETARLISFWIHEFTVA